MGTSTAPEQEAAARAWAAGDARACLRHARAGASRQPDQPVWAWWEARAHHRLGDLPRAAAALRRVLLLDPTRVEDWQRLAYVEAQLGRERHAARAAVGAAQAAPDDHKLVLLAARSCFAVDLLEEALPLYAALDRAAPLEGGALGEYALTASLCGERALASRLEARQRGEEAPALSWMDQTLAQLAAPQADEALRWLRAHNQRGLEAEAPSPAAAAALPRPPTQLREAIARRATLRWVLHLAALTPWRLYTPELAPLILTDKLTEWLQGAERDDLAGLVRAVEAALAREGLEETLEGCGDAGADAAEVLRLAGLEGAGAEAALLLAAPHLAPAHRRWLEALKLPAEDVPLDVLATVVDPASGHASALRPALRAERLGLLRWGEGEVEGARRECLNAARWWVDRLTGVATCLWRGIDSRVRVVSSEREAPPRGSARAAAEALRRDGCAVIQTWSRRPSAELEELAATLGTLALIPAEVGAFEAGARGEQARRELGRASLLSGAVVALEVPSGVGAAEVRGAVGALRALERPSLLWAPELGLAQRAARALGVDVVRVEASASGLGVAALGSGRPFRLIHPEARLEELVLGEAAAQEARSLLSYVRLRQQVLEGWGYGRQVATNRAASALIHGPSGVGKSTLARALAAELELPILEVDVSKVLSRYIGEAEKRLAEIFEEAEEGAALVFEEADGLFMKRLQVKGSGERYANLQVNYLLQRLEDFDGVVLLITREPSALDDAFARRLRFQIALEAPDEAARLQLWTRLIQRLPAPHPEGVTRLARVEASGAQIQAAVIMAATYALEAGRQAVTVQELRRGLAWVLRSEGYLVPASLRG